MLVKPNGQEIDINHHEVILGRASNVTVVVDDASVALHHATITFVEGMLEPTLRDTSKSGTYVKPLNARQAEKIETGAPGVPLENGDVIRLGTCETEFKFICKEEEAARLAR